MFSTYSLVVIVVGLGLGGFVKGIAGMGLPMIGMPVIASFIGVPHAVAVLMLPILVTNAWQTWENRKAWQRARFVFVMMAASLPGVLLGTWALVSLPEKLLSLCLGIMVSAYIALRLLHPSFTLSGAITRLLDPLIGFAGGLLQGSTGISSPAVATYLHARRLDRTTYVFALSAVFFVFTAIQVPVLAYAGVMTGERFLESVIALLPVGVAMSIGSRLGRRVRPEVFDRLVLVLLGVIALKLLYEGLK